MPRWDEEALEEHLKQLESQRDRLLGILRKVEWISNGKGDLRCPYCGHYVYDKHSETCDLGNILKED